MSKTWRFEFRCRTPFNAQLLTTIGENILAACRACHLSSNLLAVWRERFDHKFFLLHPVAMDQVVMRGATYPLEDFFFDNGFRCCLPFSVWSPQDVCLSIRPSSEQEASFVVGLDVRRQVLTELVYPEVDQDENDPPLPDLHGYMPLSFERSAFPNDQQWKIFSDMKVWMLRFENIQRPPSDSLGAFWEFNLNAMCYVFVRSITEVQVCQVDLYAPGWEDSWHWNSDGELKRIVVDPTYEKYGICPYPGIDLSAF